MKKDIKRAIIEMTVDRGLREINEDPRRSIRKLADYGKQFSKARFMQNVHAVYQDLLRNDDSPYYSAIELTLKHTEMRALKDFGINLGYNSFTKGGKVIRKVISEKGFAVPWNIYFSLNADSEKSFSPQELIPVIAQCKKFGIFAYVIELENDLTYIDSTISLFRMYDDCAFMFILPDQEITDEIASRLSECTNVFNFVNAAGEFNYSNSLILKHYKIWYGSFDSYDENTYKDIPVEEKIKDYIEFESTFVLLRAVEGTSLECILATNTDVKQTRLEPRYPLITFDFYGDSMRISELISETRCFMHVRSSGVIHTNTGNITLKGKAFDPEAIFKEAFPI